MVSLSKNSICTLGYTGRKPADLVALIHQLDAVLVDIRFSPYSRHPQWNMQALRASLDDRYLHVKALGNLNYKGDQGEGIIICNYAQGKAAVLDVLKAGRSAVLMCACRDANTCHRTTVARMLMADGLEVNELPTSQGNKAEPPGQLPLF